MIKSIKMWGRTIPVRQVPGMEDYGDWSQESGIRLRENLSDGEAYTTILHEIGHEVCSHFGVGYIPALKEYEEFISEQLIALGIAELLRRNPSLRVPWGINE